MKYGMQLLGVLVLVAVTATVAVWQLHARDALKSWDANRARNTGRPIPVRTVTVQEKEVIDTVGGTAVTLPAQSVTIEVPVSTTLGRQVTDVYHQAGATVAKDDKLVDFDQTLFQQIVEQRQAALAGAQAELATIQGLKSRSAASGLQVTVAELAVKTAEVELSQARHDLDLCQITSPIDGVLEEVQLVPGTRVSQSTTLAVIHQLDPILVQMDYPMERLDTLKVGQQAEVSLDAFPQEKLTGKVVSVSPIVSTKTRVVPVMIEVPNPGNRILAGISGFVRVVSEKRAAKVAPNIAVIDSDKQAMVVRVNEGQATMQPIRTGDIVLAGYTEVLDGLDVGDEVIVHGQDDVQEGDVVNTDWRAWARRDGDQEDQP